MVVVKSILKIVQKQLPSIITPTKSRQTSTYKSCSRFLQNIFFILQLIQSVCQALFPSVRSGSQAGMNGWGWGWLPGYTGEHGYIEKHVSRCFLDVIVLEAGWNKLNMHWLESVSGCLSWAGSPPLPGTLMPPLCPHASREPPCLPCASLPLVCPHASPMSPCLPWDASKASCYPCLPLCGPMSPILSGIVFLKCPEGLKKIWEPVLTDSVTAPPPPSTGRYIKWVTSSTFPPRLPGVTHDMCHQPTLGMQYVTPHIPGPLWDCCRGGHHLVAKKVCALSKINYCRIAFVTVSVQFVFARYCKDCANLSPWNVRIYQDAEIAE